MTAIKSIFSQQKRPWIFIICGLLLIFFINLKTPTDPDFGWHLRIGQDLLSSRSLPYLDPYSFTMPDFPWISYSWLADIIIVLVEKYLGLFSLSIFFAALATISFLLAAKTIKINPVYTIIVAVFGSILSTSVISIRPQVFSILGLAILIFVLFRWRENPQSKIVWWLPLLFAVWTNLHAAFVVGLGALFVFFLAEFIIKKVPPNKPALIFVLSSLSTFINPYGPRIYKETWITFIDFAGRAHIIEWQPLFFAGMDIFLPAVIFGLGLLAAQFFSKKQDLILIALTALFFIFAIMAWRNLPLFFIASSPLAVMTLQNQTGKKLLDLIKMPLTMLVIFALVFFAGWRNVKEVWLLDNDLGLLAQETNFPYQAVRFLESGSALNDDSRLFNEYTWGGYILWQMPSQKVFIDGRMTHWKMPGRNIFADYLTFQNAGNPNEFKYLIKKYGLNLALVRRDSPAAYKFSFLGWQNIYEDNTTIILKKP